MKSANAIKYRPDIDGLRAVAVMSVVAFHAFPDWIKGGFIGVDVFFVISGFLISTLIFQGIESNTFRYRDFYVKRIKRIFPALAVILFACLVFCFVAAAPDEIRLIGKHMAGGAFSISNLLLSRESGYFDISSNLKPLLHLWSLGVEEQYYILWPLMVVVLFKRLRSILPIILILLIMSFFLNVWFIKSKPSLVFYLPVTRGWELLIGALLAYVMVFNQGIVEWLQQRLPQQSIVSLKCHDILSCLGATLIIISLLLLNKNNLFPGWLALLPTVGSFLIISAGPYAWINEKILACRIFVFFGVISYPLYLWHWPLLVFPRIIQGEELPVLTRSLVVLISIFLAWTTYKFIEKPIRYGKQTTVKPILLISFVATIGLSGAYLYKATSVPFFYFFGKNTSMFNDLVYDTKNIYQQCPAVLINARPTLGYCSSSSAKTPTAIVFGDSHADHIFPGIIKVDTKHSWLLAGNASCPPVTGVSVQADVPECEKRSETVLNYIKGTDSLQTVVLSFFGSYAQNINFAADHVANNLGPAATHISVKGTSTLNKMELFWYGIENTVASLEQSGKKIIVVLDIPELPFFPRDCLLRPFRNNKNTRCSVSRKLVLNRQDQLRINLSKLQKNHPEVKIFDPLDFLCDAENCYAKLNDRLIYRDSHHLSIRGSELFAKHFISWLS